MTEPPVGQPRLWNHDEDRDARTYLYFAARDVYRRCKAASDFEDGVLTREGVAELRGAVRCLRQFGQLSKASTSELISPLVGDDAITEWFAVTHRFTEG